MTEIIEERKPIVKNIDLSEINTEGQVVIHVSFKAYNEDHIIRIWPTTYLICRQTGKKNKLLFYEGITMYPYWTNVPEDEKLKFTLIFNALPKSCMSFDFVEEINQPGGFEFRNIQRNRSDVYNITLS